MIRDVIQHLIAPLNGLTIDEGGFIDVLAGMVTTAEIVADDGKVRKFPIPVFTSLSSDECNNHDYMGLLVPDESKRCIVYVEAQAAQAIKVSTNATQYGFRASVICWYNSLGFTATTDLSTKISTLILGRLRRSTLPNGILTGYRMEVVGLADNNPTTFSKYTYYNRLAPFMSSPYGFFQIDVNIHFTANESPNCSPSLTPINLAAFC